MTTFHHDTFSLSSEPEVLALRDELGFSDWPAHELDVGATIRSVSDHSTHWLVLICRVTATDLNWRALGYSKTRFSADEVDATLTKELASLGIGGPFFSRAQLQS